ncbi:MAG TPA: tetratricopeptide repeat protein [Pyrinomonadaceae bacterium]|nr:tetratricopeptide repeat protein [Pyrinomonadaceae bacterium]
MKKRLAFVLAICFCFLAGPALAPVFAKDTWISVRSKNFQLIGNASEKDIRQVGIRLEQFREVFSRLFPSMNVNSPIPTTVIVFKNDESYRPFKPNANTAGYFQPGPDVNYITLRLGSQVHSEQDPFTIIFHEYTHLLVKNTSGNVPTWFNEGLAEYYSTFSITDDQKVVMGRPIANHVYLLRDNKMLSLRTLFQVDQKSPHYNERDKQSIFYAESWALIHYLILGNEGQRTKDMGKFVELLSANVPMEQAFQQAFAMSFDNMEKELHSYIQRNSYPIIRGNLSSKATYDTDLQSAPLTEAEAQAYLGDLLLHSNRADSETYLQKALTLDPNLAMANAAMGMLRVRQGKSEEALKCLERAVAASEQNYLIHYYYAYVLSRVGNRDMQTVLGFAPETATKMRAELKRAIQLRPDFPESYSLLAFVNLVTETDLTETLELLKRALTVSPNRNDLVFMLAQVQMRKEDFKAARLLIDKLSSSNDEEMRQRAAGLLAQLVSVEEHLARQRTVMQARGADSSDSALLRKTSDGIELENAVEKKYDPADVLRESLRKPAAGETQAQGLLSRIDCDAKGITFVVRIGERLLKLGTDSFSHMDLTSYSEDARGQVTCGLRKPENNVVVSYLPTTEPRSKVDGVIKSIEFVPLDFKLKATP